MKLPPNQIKTFQDTIWQYYKKNKRHFLWRSTTNPYHIFVSEVMLQQTQTGRVEQKYKVFIKKFPNFQSLANAPLHDLLQAWQGLGYNRRALYLQKSAQTIISKYNGIAPRDERELIKLPGIGKATAASIPAFAYNIPTVFIETNIRVVLIHFFLQNQEAISDKTLLNLAAQTLDKQNAREWYYALMDYGVMLKAKGINPINKCKQYRKQSKFKGSDREVRGAIIKMLLERKLSALEIVTALQNKLSTTPERTQSIIDQLIYEKLIMPEGHLFAIHNQPKNKQKIK